MEVIATVPAYAPFLPEVAAHPMLHAFRLNTAMKLSDRETIPELLKRLQKTSGSRTVWVDLKCRQIRVSRGYCFKEPEAGPRTYTVDGKTVILDSSNPRAYGEVRTPPWAELHIDHKIKLDLSKGPVQCWTQDGLDSAYIAEIQGGDQLIMLDGPQRLVGGGESINILDPSLEIEGFFTDLDLKFIEAAKSVGIHTYMLSYVEQDSDIEAMLELDPKAIIAAKIESKKGLAWVESSYAKYKDQVILVAARGDLYVEVGRPDKILGPLQTIANHDHRAILASRILTSLRKGPVPTCTDITDIAAMLMMGYNTLMIGDDICFNRDSILLALDICGAINKQFKGAK